MKFIEQVLFQRIDKDTAPGAVDYSGRKVLNPVRDIRDTRFISNEGSEEYKGENIKGTTLAYDTYASSPAATGRYKCIGTYEDTQTGVIYNWQYNFDGYHRVLSYNPITNINTVLISDDPSAQVLNFQNNPRYLITGVGIIGDLLTWTDNFNPKRYINITRSYGVLNEYKISLMKIGPRNKPVFTDKTSDSAQLVNRIADNSFQFAFRYVYLDNEVSVFSPYSKLLLADTTGIDLLFSNSRNRVLISHTIDSDVMSVLKRVELVFRIGNEPTWRVWKKIESASITATINEYFYNTSPGEAVATSESGKLFDLVPNKAKALTVFRNRTFLNVNEEGLSIPQATISAVRGADQSTTSSDSDAFMKKNGTYGVGLIEHDNFGRASGVIAKTFVSGAQLRIADSFLLTTNTSIQEDTYNTKANRINVTVGGLGIPSGRYSIGVTPELQYEKYMQVPVRNVYYRRDRITSTAVQSSEFEIAGKLFYKILPQTQTEFTSIYLDLPTDIPFVPDTTYFVKVINASSITKLEKVISVFNGNMIQVNTFDFYNWFSFNKLLVVEIFKLKNEQSLFYYEVEGPFNINSNGTFSSPVINNIKADAYYRGGSLFFAEERFFRWNGLPSSDGSYPTQDLSNYANGVSPKYIQVEQPSPLYTKQLSDTGTVTTPARIRASRKSYTPDYTKSAWSQGRPFIEASSQVLNRPSTIRFSDPYIEGSQINGLNSFPVENEYNKIGEDASPITKLIPVGNILVAVHERNITSLYVGEGVVKTGDTGFLSKTDDVVGDDTKLLGGMGSYHPESVQEVDGMAFGWDIFLGVVWRYTVEGVYAISNAGMSSYFRDKAAAYLPHKDTVAFVSGVDKYHKEYLLTLPNVWAVKESSTLDIGSTATQTQTITLNSASYTVGEVYQLSIKFYKSGATSNDNITFNVLHGAANIDVGSVSYLVNTQVAGDAKVVIMEFVYTGAASLSVQLSNISAGTIMDYSVDERTIKGETWAYNYAKKEWAHRYSFVPEYFVRSGNRLFSFKFGRLYKHNDSSTYNNYYGHQYSRRLEFSCNPQPGKVKTWSAVQIAADVLSIEDANNPPLSGGAIQPASVLKVFEATNEFGQATYTRAKEFTKKEGVYCAPILRDTNTNPLLLSAGQIALRDGKDMRSKTLEVVINNDATGRSLIQKVNIVGETSEYSN
jgi:hypothetical protein